MKVKELLYTYCKAFIEKRIKVTQIRISELQDALQSETKSSAGDKHETGRAMLQLEREKIGVQWANLQKEQELLSKINIKNKSEVACLGSVVYTSKSVFFIAISKGIITVHDKEYVVIAPKSPIGKVLLGKKQGESFMFRNISHTILELK